MNNLKAERTLTAEELVTVRNELLFVAIQDAYLRGLDWGRKYGSTEEEELKASYDYADKTTSGLRSQSLSTQQPMGEVRVKALEWVEVTSTREDGPPEPIGEYVAETPFGSYYIDMYFGTDSYGWSANFEASDIDGSDSDSPEKAKAAAQADYERGILSALHPNQESGE